MGKLKTSSIAAITMRVRHYNSFKSEETVLYLPVEEESILYGKTTRVISLRHIQVSEYLGKKVNFILFIFQSRILLIVSHRHWWMVSICYTQTVGVMHQIWHPFFPPQLNFSRRCVVTVLIMLGFAHRVVPCASVCNAFEALLLGVSSRALLKEIKNLSLYMNL